MLKIKKQSKSLASVVIPTTVILKMMKCSRLKKVNREVEKQELKKEVKVAQKLQRKCLASDQEMMTMVMLKWNLTIRMELKEM
jgi:hypothetical protein